MRKKRSDAREKPAPACCIGGQEREGRGCWSLASLAGESFRPGWQLHTLPALACLAQRYLLNPSVAFVGRLGMLCTITAHAGDYLMVLLSRIQESGLCFINHGLHRDLLALACLIPSPRVPELFPAIAFPKPSRI